MKSDTFTGNNLMYMVAIVQNTDNHPNPMKRTSVTEDAKTANITLYSTSTLGQNGTPSTPRQMMGYPAMTGLHV
jgi:hypothetical protein